MKKYLYVFLLLSITSAISCSEDDKEANSFNWMEGDWLVEEAILDADIEDGWGSTNFSFESINENELILTVKDRPSQWHMVWPNQSSLKATSAEDSSAVFLRDDNIQLTIISKKENLLIYLHPPRSYSYDDDCSDQGDHQLICEESGSWVFKLKKQ